MTTWHILTLAGAATVLIFGTAILSGSGYPVDQEAVDLLLALLLGAAVGGPAGYLAGQRRGLPPPPADEEG